MRILDTILGRSKPVRPNLDALFGLPSAAITLEVESGLGSTGRAAICFKPPAGQPFEDIQREITQLLAEAPQAIDAPDAAPPAPGGTSGTAGAARASRTDDLEITSDDYGYRWMVIEDPDISDLVTRVHVVNSTLEDNGYGPQLLASVFAFAHASAATADSTSASSTQPSVTLGKKADIYLVYLYKRGSFYPFAPTGKDRRDSEAELRLKAVVSNDLNVEADLTRWFPMWGMPV